MSWNSMSRLGCDVVLGDIQAQNISCKSITVDDASNPTIPTELTIDTINCQTGNISNLQSDEITCPIFHCPANYDSQNISNPKWIFMMMMQLTSIIVTKCEIIKILLNFMK